MSARIEEGRRAENRYSPQDVRIDRQSFDLAALLTAQCLQQGGWEFNTVLLLVRRTTSNKLQSDLLCQILKGGL